MGCPFEGCLTSASHGHAASARRLRQGRSWDELERVLVMDAGDVAATGTSTRDIVVWIWHSSDAPQDDGEDDVIYGGRTEDFDWVPDAPL